MATNNDIARASLDLAKKMFKEFTGTTIEMARELIQLEDTLNAISSDIPKAEDEKVKIDTPLEKKVAEPVINKVSSKAVLPIDDSDDLPF